MLVRWCRLICLFTTDVAEHNSVFSGVSCCLLLGSPVLRCRLREKLFKILK